MAAKTLDVLGVNRLYPYTHLREGSRGIVLRGNQILLSRETRTDWWLIPGGGQEPGETPAACCAREIREETGCLVRVGPHYLTLREHYEDWLYVSRYFVCEEAGWGDLGLTEVERGRGLTPAWLPLSEALDIFGHHQDWAEISEEKRGSYLREYIALREYLNFIQN